MIHEISIAGVFMSSGLVTAIVALLLSIAISRLLGWLGLHRRLWHPALVDTSLFIILWAALETQAVPI